MQKIIVVVVSLGLAMSAAIFSYANSFKRGNLTFVQSWPVRPAPLDARIAQLLLEEVVSNNDGNMPALIPDAVVSHSLAAFRNDPTDQAAVAILGLSIKGRSTVRRLYQSSFALNKRQVITAAWLADDAARRGDVAATVFYFDTILRRDNQQSEAVLDKLVKLMHNREAVPIMVQLLRKRSSWHGKFWAAAADDPKALPNAALARAALIQDPSPQSNRYDELLLMNLVTLDRFDDAWSLYAKLRPSYAVAGVEGYGAGHIGFSKLGALAPFAWVVPNDRGDLGSFIESNGLLNVSVIGLASGVVARRLVRIDTGMNSLTFQVYDPEELPRGLKFALEVRCVEGRKYNRRVVANAGQRGVVRFDMPLQPGFCQFAWFELSVINETDNGADVSISQVRIT